MLYALYNDFPRQTRIALLNILSFLGSIHGASCHFTSAQTPTLTMTFSVYSRVPLLHLGGVRIDNEMVGNFEFCPGSRLCQACSSSTFNCQGVFYVRNVHTGPPSLSSLSEKTRCSILPTIGPGTGIFEKNPKSQTCLHRRSIPVSLA